MRLVLAAHLFSDFRLLARLQVHYGHSMLLKSSLIFCAPPAVAHPIGPVRGGKLPERIVVAQEVERTAEIAVIAQVNFVARNAAWPQEPGDLRNRAIRVSEVFKAGMRKYDVE